MTTVNPLGMNTNPFGSSPVVSVGADPAGVSGGVIDTGPFWPVVDPRKARLAMRLDGTVLEERLRAALVEAAISAIETLSDWKFACLAEGFTALAQVPAPQVDGESIHVHRFLRAVHCMAAANLAERYRGFDATGAGARHAELVESPIEDLRRDAAWALADIQGRGRTTVELI